MIKNYLKIGIRNLIRHKSFTLINIIGLAVGLSAFLLINEYVKFEQSYDAHFTQSAQMYRVGTLELANGEIDVKDANAYSRAAKVLYDELPEVIHHSTSYQVEYMTIRNGEDVFRETNMVSADTNFLELFNYEVINGSTQEMFKEPYSIVLTKSKAEFYFGDENPIGKTLDVLDEFNRPFQVTGVIQDIPMNTHYKFDMLISHITLKDRWDYETWNGNNYYGYVVLAEGKKPGDLTDQLDQISKKYLGDDTRSQFDLFPVKDIHLKSEYTYEPEPIGSQSAVTFMAIISWFILIIAWVNYINLSTARAVERAKEVGLRKVVGAFKVQLITQFLLEALIVNFIAACLALFMAELLLPYFFNLTGVFISTSLLTYKPILIELLLIFLFGSILSGFYPALVLSGFKPISVLKGHFGTSSRGVLLRKSLVIFQFVASITLIAGTLIVNKQLRFMQNKDKGISVDHVIGFYLPEVDEEQEEAHRSKIKSFKAEMAGHPAILAVGATSNLPGGGATDINTTSNKVRIFGITEPKEGITYLQFNDDQFLEAVDMQLAAGRDFDQNISSDSIAIMCNEAFLRRFDITNPDSVLNEYLMFGESEGNTKYKLVGVVKDFNRSTLKSPVEPTLYIPASNPANLVLKLDPKNYDAGLEYLALKWKEFFPENPLDYSFLDQRFAKLIQQDQRFGEVFMIFSFLAILIASLGLFGLSSYTAIQRTKEVGIRKVLGASVPSIIGIFYKDFLQLLIIASVLGIPFIYYSMNFWLEGYAFRVSFPWEMIIVSMALVIILALSVVGYQTIRVAVLNPAQTLKYE